MGATTNQQQQNHRLRAESSLDSAVVEAQKIVRSHRDYLTIVMYHNGQTISSN